jgi:hypothetical protein
MNDELVVKEPSAPKRFRLHPEELAAILFALLVIARLAFPDLINRLPEFVKIFLAFLAVLVFPGFLITSWFSTLHKLFLRRVVYSFALGYAVWTIPSSLLMMLKSSWTVFYVIYFVVNLFLIGFTVYYLRFRRRPISADRQDNLLHLLEKNQFIDPVGFTPDCAGSSCKYRQSGLHEWRPDVLHGDNSSHHA